MLDFGLLILQHVLEKGIFPLLLLLEKKEIKKKGVNILHTDTDVKLLL